MKTWEALKAAGEEKKIRRKGAVPRYDYFTKDGQYDLDDPDPDCDIHPITDVKPLEYDKEK